MKVTTISKEMTPNSDNDVSPCSSWQSGMFMRGTESEPAEDMRRSPRARGSTSATVESDETSACSSIAIQIFGRGDRGKVRLIIDAPKDKYGLVVNRIDFQLLSRDESLLWNLLLTPAVPPD
jgi:hypothetical protein